MHGSAMMGEYIKSSKLINNQIEGRYLNLSTSSSIDDIGRNGIRKTLRYLNLLFKVFYNLLVWKPNLCYLTPSSYVLGMAKDSLIVAIIRFFRVNHIFHFHNKGVSFFSTNWLNKSIYSFVFKKAKVILLSSYLYKDIQDYLPESRVAYCPNGIPRLGNLENNYNKEKSSDPFIKILFLSNLMLTKGIIDLLKACKSLKDQGIKYQCWVAGGEGDLIEADLIMQIKKFDVEGEVFYKGEVKGAEKSALFSKANIFIHPSYNDCFPLVILEAMQASLPVISTFEGAIPEIIEQNKTGILVNQRDVSALTAALVHLISSPETRVEMGKAGKERFERLYTIQSFESNFLKTLQALSQ
jgi:glycosyltransferase involved in cell wall biosynthesis